MNRILGTAPPLPPLGWVRRPRRSLPYPLGEAGCRIFARSRHGLYAGMRALGVGEGTEVLIPAYHHGSEVEAIIRTGATPRFYAGTAALEPDEPELDGLRGPRTRALQLIHHLGFPQDSARWRRWCDEHGILLVEDGAPAWLSETGGYPVGSFGDLAVFSLYKTIGLPDGNATVCRQALAQGRGRPAVGLRTAARRQAAWLAQRVPAPSPLAGGGNEHGKPFDPRRAFDLGDPDAAPARLTAYLLPRLGDLRIAEQRRRNYAYLLDRLRPYVPKPFDRLADGACPWMFPVHAIGKGSLIAHLLARGVRPIDLWSAAHPALATGRFPDADGRRTTTIALPVHQGLRSHDLDLIAAAALAWFEAQSRS